MAYKALYRTYRPQTFEEVAGQQHIVRTLKNALASNKIAHAYLFCGPRGTGKTTMAKLFAKALNCEEGTGKQCNKCSNCVEIMEGSHPDVIEIDAASNNGVEEVRNLIDTVNYLPIKGKYKVYIIDEVHMMTTNAFNALLKTLEEPPAHVIFILATTEPHNIIPTILSRCQRYDFTKVSDGDIEERMMTILEKEGVQYDKEAVRAIISLADGGMRDALSILDQILAYSGNQLSVDDVYNVFGLTSVKDKLELIKDINSGDVSRTLERIKSFSEGGVDLKRLTQDVLEILKDVLIYKKTNSDEQLGVLNLKDASDLANIIPTKKLHEMIGSFLRIQIDFKTSPNIKTLFEVAVLKLLTSEDTPVETVKVVEKVVEKPVVQEVKPEPTLVETPAPKVEKIKPEVVAKPAPQPIVEPTPVVENKSTEIPDWLVDDTDEKKTVETEGEQYELDDDVIIKLMCSGNKDQKLALVSRWDELNSYLCHPTLGDVVAMLKDGKPFIVSNNAVVLQYDFEKLATKANVKTNSDKIADILSKMLGKEVFVYALSHSESVRLTTAYQNLRQVNKLPVPADCVMTLEDLRK